MYMVECTIRNKALGGFVKWTLVFVHAWRHVTLHCDFVQGFHMKDDQKINKNKNK